MGLLHHKLGHRSRRLLLHGDTANFWKGIEVRVDPDPFWTSCQISTINKKPISKTPLNPKTPFKWVFMDTIPAISSTSLTKQFFQLTLNCGCLFQDSKTLWNGKYNYRGSHGQARYVSVKICKSISVWLVVYSDNSN